MARALGVTEFMAKKFDEFEFTDKWLEAMGKPERNFKMIIYGKPKNGKTEFCIQFAKFMTNFGKVLYNSFEQGHSKSLQDAFRRQNMEEVKGKIIVTHKEKYDEMFARLKRKKSPNIIFIDSLQYIKLSADQWKELIEKFPRKVFIVISHASGDEPKGSSAEAIQYDVDISVLVKGFAAHCQGRFGGGAQLIIWEEGHQRYLKRINTKGTPAAKTPSPHTYDLFSDPIVRESLNLPNDRETSIPEGTDRVPASSAGHAGSTEAILQPAGPVQIESSVEQGAES